MVFRLIRASVVEKLEEEYITSARARGVPPHQILFRHILKNSLMPLLGISGSLFAQILSGSFLVELIFSVPGLAHYFVESIGNRDYSVALGITLIYSLVLIVMNFIFHYVAELIDPRLAVTR